MFKKFFEDKLPPLRDFHGIEVIKDSEKYLKVCCSLHDKDGESIEKMSDYKDQLKKNETDTGS